MNIGIIQSVIGAGGGIDMVLFSLLKKLATSNHKVTIYTVGQPRHDLSQFNIYKVKKIFPVKIPLFGVYQKIFESTLAKKAKDEDIIIALTGDLFVPANKTQKTIFYSQNNFADPTKTDTSKYRDGLWKYYYLPYRRLMNKMKKNIGKYNIKFIANSEYVKEQLKRELNVDAEIIYPPVNLETFYPQESTRRKGIMTVGRFSKEKNMHKIIELTGDLDCPTKLFGSVTKTNRTYYQSLISAGKPKGIKFYTNQPLDLMITQLHKSKVFISASDETFGIAVVEAMASGCIPIVPDSTAHRETVPFGVLRPIGHLDDEAIKIQILKALDGGFDYLLPEIKEHIKKFDKSVFQNKFIEAIES